MPTYRAQLVILPLFFLVTSCASPLKLDSEMSAIEAQDYTALISGCGTQVSDGFLVCRKTEGEAANDSLTFHAPPVNCKSGSCVSFKIFFADGSPTYGSNFPAGITRIEIPWKDLLHQDTFELGHRGFWGFSYRITFTDNDGHEREAYSQGEIYLRVIKKGYTSLHEVKDDPSFSWQWKINTVPVKVTSSMRTHVGEP